MTPEGLVKKQICDYLATRNDVMFWLNSSTAIYDPIKKIRRRNNSPYQMLGTADILGIVRGRPLAIEVKSEKGRLSEHQKIFLLDFSSNGGVALVARSYQDVKVVLDSVNPVLEPTQGRTKVESP